MGQGYSQMKKSRKKRRSGRKRRRAAWGWKLRLAPH
jgi:hypothetical protein